MTSQAGLADAYSASQVTRTWSSVYTKYVAELSGQGANYPEPWSC